MIRRIVLFVAGAVLLTASEPLVSAVDSIGLTVSNLDQSLDFYTKILSFEKISETEYAGAQFEHLHGMFGLRARTARLKLGGEFIELTEYLAPRGRPAPPDSRANDRWFQHVAIIVSDMDKAYRWLRKHKVQHASSGPQRLPDWNPNAGGIQAFYFRDPDGHALEILAFPAGKGDPKWQRKDAMFLGIDHTAIVVLDTDASLKFYRDTLGMRVAGQSENYGTEQEHLNNVFGARLRITALRAGAGPGIELLEYLAPRDGRPYPSDEKANDLIHWQTRLTGPALSLTVDRLKTIRSPWISTGAVEVPATANVGFRRALTVRDPDGHAVQVVEH
jgi:catechol 2,3-dioxygenase-like lactoylglutathione lyase family enzyme